MMNYNRQSEYTEISAHNDAFQLEWTEVEEAKVYVGNDALRLNPNLKYRLLWPLQRGTFNSRDYGHVRKVVDDLALLWRRAIECELKISPDDFNRYAVVLVLPDCWERVEIKACIDALLGGQKAFKAVTALQESQAITFGSGVSSGLVVNCGAQSISVACVDEGYLVPESRIKLPFGGDEVTRLFASLLKLHEFPYEFNLQNPTDWSLLDELKERTCTLIEADLGQSAGVFEFYLRHPDHPTRQFLFKMFEERLMAPLALFESEASWLLQQGTPESEGIECDAFDCEDPFTAISGLDSEMVASEETPAVSEVAKEEVKSEITVEKVPVTCDWSGCKQTFEDLKAAVEHFEASHAADTGCSIGKCKYAGKGSSLLCHVISEHYVIKTLINEEIPSQNSCISRIAAIEPVPMSVDEAAFESLLRLNDSERIKRCAGSIILAGGAQLVPGFADVFFSTIIPKFPLNPLTALMEVKIFPNMRDLDARFVAWKGGAVYCKLESTAETWITSEEWINFGMRSVKEKIAFIN